MKMQSALRIIIVITVFTNIFFIFMNYDTSSWISIVTILLVLIEVIISVFPRKNAKLINVFQDSLILGERNRRAKVSSIVTGNHDRRKDK